RIIFRLGIFRFSRDRLFELRVDHLFKYQFRYLFNRLRLILGGVRSDCLGLTSLGDGLPVDHSVDEIDGVAVRRERHQDSAVADVLLARWEERRVGKECSCGWWPGQQDE